MFVIRIQNGLQTTAAEAYFHPMVVNAAMKRCATRTHSVMMRSAHSTRETKIAGVPNFAPH
jgi:hypothetical protein